MNARIKSILIIFCMIFTAYIIKGIYVYASPLNLNFDDQNLYNCIINQLNADKLYEVTDRSPDTHNLTDDELTKVTNLSCSGAEKADNLKISSVKGISKLVNLTNLDLSTNKISSIDISKNILLKSLNLSNNLLTGLDISKNIDLTSLFINGNNISSIDVSSNTKLTDSNIKSDSTTNIIRVDKRSSNNNLASLSISSGTLAFDASMTVYNVTVDQSITSVTINATISDNKSIFVSGFEPRTVNNLSLGNNEVQIKVKAENESIKTYTINVNRNDGRSTNNYLSSLSLSAGKIDFVKDALQYSIKVLFDINSVEVTAMPEDAKAIVSSVGGNNLEVGENTIAVTVTAENGGKRIYVILVEKLAKGVSLSNNNYLSSLVIGKYKIKLIKNIYDYKLVIETEKSLEVIPVPFDDNTQIEVNGNDNIKNGSIITVSVTAENGDKKEYKIKVYYRQSPYIFYGLFGITLVSILLSIYIIYKHKQNKKVIDNLYKEFKDKQEYLVDADSNSPKY